MRGNRLVRGGDPMKTRSQKRKERKERVDKSKRVQRLKKRLGRISARKFAAQEDDHTTALMESYILRRKAERAAERERAAEEEAAKKAAEGEGSSPSGDDDDDPYAIYEEDAYDADENPRARHKRMKDRLKGIKKGAAPVTKGKNGSIGGGKQTGKDNGSAKRKPAPKTAKKGKAYDPRQRRVQTRSLY